MKGILLSCSIFFPKKMVFATLLLLVSFLSTLVLLPPLFGFLFAFVYLGGLFVLFVYLCIFSAKKKESLVFGLVWAFVVLQSFMLPCLSFNSFYGNYLILYYHLFEISFLLSFLLVIFLFLSSSFKQEKSMRA